MSKIQVPDHVAKSIEAEQKAQQQEETKTEESTENVAYVKEGARVLDPTLLEKSFLERMPSLQVGGYLYYLTKVKQLLKEEST